MNIYLVTGVLNVHTGLLLLNKDQAKRRNHVLVKQTDSIKSLKLNDEEQAFIDAGEDNPLAVYKLIDSTQFKVGEKIGYDGGLNKVLASLLKPVAEIEETTDEKVATEIDELLVNAIIELDVENAAHWTTQGKPEIEILKGLLKRKVSGKERDAAFAVCIDRQEVLIETIGMLIPESDEWTEDNKPNLDVISKFVGREVSQKECDLAYQEYLVAQDSGD